MSDVLTTREAAQRAGISRERLLRRVERGEIAGQYIAGRWLIDRPSLERFAERSRKDNGGDRAAS